MAIFSSMLLFGVNFVIRRQFRASSSAEHRETKNSATLSSCDDSASDSGYKDTESQPMLEDECANKLGDMHGSLKISELLLVIDRETVL